MPKQDDNGIVTARADHYEKAYVEYSVKVDNQSPHSLFEVKVIPFISNKLFIIDKEEEKLGMLGKGESRTATFRLRPQNECGNISIRSKVAYYDPVADEPKEMKVKQKDTSIICPIMNRKEIVEKGWFDLSDTLLRVKMATNDIIIPE